MTTYACHGAGHCLYLTNGQVCPSAHGVHHYEGDSDWPGSQSAQDDGDRIGMLLDIDAGTMTCFKNDEVMGVMNVSN